MAFRVKLFVNPLQSHVNYNAFHIFMYFSGLQRIHGFKSTPPSRVYLKVISGQNK